MLALRHHITPTHLDTYVDLCMYIYIYFYIPVLWTRRDRLRAAAYIVLLDKQCQYVFAISVTFLGSSTTVV